MVYTAICYEFMIVHSFTFWKMFFWFLISQKASTLVLLLCLLNVHWHSNSKCRLNIFTTKLKLQQKYLSVSICLICFVFFVFVLLTKTSRKALNNFSTNVDFPASNILCLKPSLRSWTKNL